VQELKNIEAKVQGTLERIQQAIVRVRPHSWWFILTAHRTTKRSKKICARAAKWPRSAWSSSRAGTRVSARSAPRIWTRVPCARERARRLRSYSRNLHPCKYIFADSLR
jgi:hypothetical protein